MNLARVVRDPLLGAKLYRRLRRAWAANGILLDARKVLEQPRNGKRFSGTSRSLLY